MSDTEVTPVAVICSKCGWSGHVTEIVTEMSMGINVGDCSIDRSGELECPRCSGLVKRTIH